MLFNNTILAGFQLYSNLIALRMGICHLFFHLLVLILEAILKVVKGEIMKGIHILAASSLIISLMLTGCTGDPTANGTIGAAAGAAAAALMGSALGGTTARLLAG